KTLDQDRDPEAVDDERRHALHALPRVRAPPGYGSPRVLSLLPHHRLLRAHPHPVPGRPRPTPLPPRLAPRGRGRFSQDRLARNQAWERRERASIIPGAMSPRRLGILIFPALVFLLSATPHPAPAQERPLQGNWTGGFMIRGAWVAVNLRIAAPGDSAG